MSSKDVVSKLVVLLVHLDGLLVDVGVLREGGFDFVKPLEELEEQRRKEQRRSAREGRDAEGRKDEDSPSPSRRPRTW